MQNGGLPMYLVISPQTVTCLVFLDCQLAVMLFILILTINKM